MSSCQIDEKTTRDSSSKSSPTTTNRIPNNEQATEATSASLDDVVSFSLSSLCAIRLNQLYPGPYHESFRLSYIRQIVQHFGLPEKVVQSCREFLEDDEFTFLSAIKQHHRHRPFRIIEELVLLSIKSGSYDARAHYLIIDVAELLGMPRELVEIHCESIYDIMLNMQQAAIDEEQNKKQDLDREKRESRNKLKKYIMIGLASLGGGAVIGVTGGLAAPIVASAFAGVLGAGTIAMSTAAAGVVGSIFGVAGAGLTASKMNKRIGDLEEFQFLSLNPENDQTSLTITIAISGLISNEGAEEFAKPWKTLNNSREQYCLCYESKYLLELSAAMDYLLSFVVSYATQEALKYTFLASVMSAIAWPAALISIANIIDNPWDVCLKRSAQAGRHLADVLLSRQQGQRPASLIGFNLGARVIFFCLQELAERDNSEGIIGDVVLLGAPVSASVDQWKPLGRVVSGRIVNGYSSSDWLLKFLYRTSSAAIRVAGLQEIRWQDRRMKNVDLTPIVSSHMDYHKKLSEILAYVNIRTVVKFEDDLAVLANGTSTATTTKLVKKSNGVCESPSTNSMVSDSGIERTISNATDISTSSNQAVTATSTSEGSQNIEKLDSVTCSLTRINLASASSQLVQSADTIVDATTQSALIESRPEQAQHSRLSPTSASADSKASCLTHQVRASRLTSQHCTVADTTTTNTTTTTAKNTNADLIRRQEEDATCRTSQQQRQQVSVYRVYGKWRPSSLVRAKRVTTDLRDPQRESRCWMESTSCFEHDDDFERKRRPRRRARSV